jgi:signal transduction histidine kinase/DNA-binding response OmpR family regulator
MNTGRFEGLRHWSQRSLANAFTLPAVFIAIASSLLVALISLGVIYSVEQVALREKLQEKSSRLADRVRETIGILEKSTSDIATSSMFMTALLDSKGRDAYVVPFLESYRFPVAVVSGLALCDLNGEKLAAMRSPLSECRASSPGFKQAIADGKTRRELGRLPNGHLAWMVYQAVMFPYTGTAEGLVVVQVDLIDLLRSMPKDLDLQSAALVREDSSETLANAEMAEAATFSLVSASTLLFEGTAMGLPFSIAAVAKDHYTPFGYKLVPLFFGYLLGSLLLVLGIVYSMRRISRQLIAPLTELTDISRRIAETGDLSIAIPQNEAGEVGDLARAMDVMVETLRLSESTLEAKVALRTRELRVSEAAAASASQAKSQFLANMSHEIRTPMNAILGMLKLLQNTGLTPRQLDYLTKSEGAAKSLLVLINDILDFSKVEAGKMTLELRPFRVDRLLRDLSVIVSAYVGDKNIEVLFDIDPAIPEVLHGDALRLQQVLLNVSSNAVKFTEQGEVVIRLRVLERREPMVVIDFAVQDSGIGVSLENQAHIFSGFSQAEASTTRRFGGTGLGLAISKLLVELMGGEFHLVSQPGKGSTFSFSLQLPVVLDIPEELRPVERPVLQFQSVLLVEDNHVARDVLRLMIQSLGWQVEVAASGAQALATIQQRSDSATAPFQILFIDSQMPEMDGWETVRRIRQNSQEAAQTKPLIIMFTAHGREMLAHRTPTELAMLNGYLVKPVTASMLFDAVMDALANDSRPLVAVQSSSNQRRLIGMRLLVVEDNMINQQVAEELLTAEGALVSLAANGELGVQAVAAAQPPFDAVLMDLQMPVMDGYAATHAIRSQPETANLPIIAMTANAMASDRVACLAAGMNDHVGKPFDLNSLVATLLRHTGRTALWSEPQAVTMGLAADVGDRGRVEPPLDAVDVKGALNRMGGNERLFTKALQSLLKDMAQMPEQLAEHLGLAQLQEAARLMHTLKGLAATVGANALSRFAQETELKLKQGAVTGQAEEMVLQTRSAIETAAQTLQALVLKLASERPQPSGARSAESDVPLDPEQVCDDLTQLLALLRQADMDAMKVYARLAEQHGPALGAALTQLDNAMEALDFGEAARLCEDLVRRLRN